MSAYKTEITDTPREAYREMFRAYLRGERPTVLFSEQFEDAAFSALDARAEETDAAIGSAGTRHPYLTRMLAVLAQSVARDAKYLHANRRFLFAHAADTKLREDFLVFANAATTAGGLPT